MVSAKQSDFAFFQKGRTDRASIGCMTFLLWKTAPSEKSLTHMI